MYIIDMKNLFFSKIEILQVYNAFTQKHGDAISYRYR